MRIVGVELTPVRATREMGRSGPADQEKAASRHVICELRTDAGITGLGEMSDVGWELSPEKLERLKARLVPLLVGRSPFDLTSIQVSLGRQEWEHQVVCGIDIALHDAACRALGVPLYQLFGGRCRTRVPFAYPLAPCRSAADVEANLRRVERLLDSGHATVRYYFGADLEMDERFLGALRRRWEDGVRIAALDASGRFDAAAAIAAIRRLAPLGPGLIESPVRGRHRAAVEEFERVREAVDVPVGEHVPDGDTGVRLARNRSVDVFNLGVGNAGLTACRRLFGLAELFDIDALLGSTVELSIGTAARAHLAAALPDLALPCYLAGPLVYQEQVVAEKVRYEAGRIVVPEGPGLGVVLDRERLAALRLW
jgi:muconate cycloisomerase